MQITILCRPAGADCISILAELPDWFGIPAANLAYSCAAETGPTWVAVYGGRTIGVMVLKDTGFAALDVYLLAVRPQYHGEGVGRALVEQARNFAQQLGKTYVTVKTQGPSVKYEAYGHTRAFYEAVGFVGVEEFTEIWGTQNPCLIMIMPI